MNQISHLYRVTDPATGKFYIGKHVGQTQNRYWGSGKRWKAYLRKHKPVNLKYEILVVAETNYIFDLEGRYITLDFITNNPLCMNLKQGGLGGIGLTQEAIESIRNKLRGKTSWNKGIPMSPETKIKLSIAKKGQPAPNKGKPMSEEAKKKVSESRKGKGGWAKGISPSAEKRAKISNSLMGNIPWNKGVKVSDEVKERLRTVMLGRKHTEETKQKMRASHAARKQGVMQ
jgi:hypothetical protein